MMKLLRYKNLHTWLPGYARDVWRRSHEPPFNGLRHILFALCDHFEPLWGKAPDDVGDDRVRVWQERYPLMTASFRDADGKPPQHTFFYPGEEFRPGFFDRIEALVRGGFGEVELHMHHDNATSGSFQGELLKYISLYARRGHFSRPADGTLRYGFIHGNWALANGRPDGRLCGVDNELPILFGTGCYADFTFPSAPDITQPNIVNSIYWPTGDRTRRRAYEWGERARVGGRFCDRILLVQGPLALVRRPGSLGVRIEASAITANDPATPSRIRSWVAQNIHVDGRPEWVFIKVHTHGAPEAQAASLLGSGGIEMHRELAAHYNDGIRYSLHYVTAREMVNIMYAAMDGKTGNPNAFRDYFMPAPLLVA